MASTSEDDNQHHYSTDDSHDEESILSGDVDIETEDISKLNTEIKDPFLFQLCDPNLLMNNCNDEDHVVEVTSENDPDVGVNEVEQPVMNVVFPIHDPTQKWKYMKPRLGEKYENPGQLRYCVTNYAIANGYQLYFAKNGNVRLLVKCGKSKDPNYTCPFKLFASWMNKEKTFQVKTLEETHTCERNYAHNQLAKPEWISKAVLPALIKNQEMQVRDIQDHVFRKYLCKVSAWQCHRARLRALYQIEGSLVEHYGRVWEYGAELLRSNPGSTVKITVDEGLDEKKYFKGMYVCFKALKDG